jgi:hypothetical protein
MYQEAHPKSGLSQLDRLGHGPHVRFGAVLALALAAAFVAWLVVGNRGHSSPANPAAASKPVAGAATPQTAGVGPVAQSVQDLKQFAAAIGHPIYWAGPKLGNTYELTQTRNGRVFIRYVPSGVRVGVNKPLLTIATYPFPHAFAALQALAKNQGGAIKLDHSGIALVDQAYPKSIHLAYPGLDYEIEVFSTSPLRTRQVVASGQIAALP